MTRPNSCQNLTKKFFYKTTPKVISNPASYENLGLTRDITNKHINLQIPTIAIHSDHHDGKLFLFTLSLSQYGPRTLARNHPAARRSCRRSDGARTASRQRPPAGWPPRPGLTGPRHWAPASARPSH